MKKILLVLLIVCALPVRSENMEDEVWKAFSNAFLETVKTEVAKKAVNYMGQQAFGAAGANVGSTAFAVYGVYTGVDGYLKADSDSQKYYAATQTVAAVVTAIPATAPIGLLMTLANIGQQLLGDYVTLDEQKEIAALVLEVQKIYENVQKTAEKLVHSDAQYITTLYKKYMDAIVQMASYSHYLISECKQSQLEANSYQALKCIDVITKLHYTKRYVIAIGYRLVHFSGEFLSFDKFLKSIESNIETQQFTQALEQLQKQVDVEKNDIKLMVESVSVVVVEEVLRGLVSQRSLKLEDVCVLELQKQINNINKYEIELFKQSQKKSIQEELLLSFALEIELAKKWNQEVCFDENKFKSTRLKQVHSQLINILNAKNAEVYLSQMEALP